MQRIAMTILLCGAMVFLTTGCPSDGGTEKDLKLDKTEVELAPEKSMDVKVTEGKATAVAVDPKSDDSKVKATLEGGNKIVITADKGAKDATVKVTGAKGTQNIKVKIKP